MQKVLISAAAIVGIAAGNAQASDATSNDTSPKAAKHHHVAAKKVAAHHKAHVPAAAAAYQAQAVVDNAPPPDLAAPLVPVARFFNSIPLPAKDGTLTYHGITVYGGLDMGLGYQSHGAPLSSIYGPGRNYLVTPTNSHTQIGLMPNALSYSNFGIKGVEEITPGLSFVFNAQTTFLPMSGALSNGNQSQARNNGVPVSSRTSGGDSSRDGQIDNGLAYAGFSSPTFGTLTYGRQNSLALDAVIAYDPMSGSNAFSLIGYAGGTGGGGNTEDARWDNSLKYRVNFGPFRAAGMYKFEDFGNSNRHAYAAQLGGEYQGFSADAIYSAVSDSVTTASIPGGITATNYDQVNATESNNYAIMGVVSYKIDRFKFFGGFERLQYDNPSTALPSGSPGEGIQLATITTTAFGGPTSKPKLLDVFWGGLKYAVRDNVDLIGAYYHYYQHGFSTTNNQYTGAGCVSRLSGACAGTLDAISAVVDYRFSRHFDVYAGAMYSAVHGGLSNGYSYLGATKANAGTTGAPANTIDPMVGARFQF